MAWSKPGNIGSSTADYAVQYREQDGGEAYSDAGHSGDATKTTISGLQNGTCYEVRVQATNPEGTSDWSGPESGCTKSNAQPEFTEGETASREVDENTGGGVAIGSPVGATDEDTDDTLTYSLTGTDVAFFDVDTAGGQLKTKETLNYEDPQDADGDNEYVVTLGVTDGLDANGNSDMVIDDTITVTIGVGDEDNEKPGKPNPPDVSGDGQSGLIVSWSEPENTGPAITDYDVWYHEDGSSADFTDAGHNGTATESNIASPGGDDTGPCYEVQVRATNDEGTGEWSDPGTGCTTSLGLVQDLSVTPRDGALAIDWSAPLSGPSPDSYEVQYKLSSATDWPTVSRIVRDGTVDRIRGLENGTPYDVRVRACIDMGTRTCGPWSEVTGVEPVPELARPTIAPASDRRSISVSYVLPTSTRFDYYLGLFVESTTGVEIVGHRIRRSQGSSNYTFSPTAGGEYKVGLTACKDGSVHNCLPYAMSEDSLTKLAAPKLDVIPLPERKARLVWDPIPYSRSTYAVNVREVSSRCIGITACWQHPKLLSPMSAVVTGNRYDIDLTSILMDSSKGLDDIDAFQFRVRATGFPDIGILDSGYSDLIMIKDSSIISINGNSIGADAGRALVKWNRQSDATSYTLRWRMLGLSNERPHTDPDWRLDSDSLPESYTDEETITDPSQVAFTIEPLDLDVIYAVQLSYKRIVNGREERVFSARDHYVWPSTTPADGGDRIATFPLKQRNKTYSYVFCEDTFPKGNASSWRDFIKHAFSQWEIATDHLVSIRRIIAIDGKQAECADYEMFVTGIRDGVIEYMEQQRPLPTFVQVEAHAQTLLLTLDGTGIESTINEDKSLSEVLMSLEVDDLLEQVGVFDELATKIKASRRQCGPGYRACTSREDNPDIILERSVFENDSLTLPNHTRLNSCGGASTLYGTLLHEMGHALGVTGGTTGSSRQRAHPQIPDSVVSSTDYFGYDCFPYPFDVLAMYALYQIGE